MNAHPPFAAAPPDPRQGLAVSPGNAGDSTGCGAAWSTR